MTTTTTDRRIVVSPRAADRLAEARRWLTNFPSVHRVLVVGPSELAAAELLRELTLERGALFAWERTTLTRLARTLGEAEHLERELVPLGALAAEALAARVVHSSQPQDLGLFGPIARRPGFITALARTLQELRLARKTPGELETVSVPLSRLLASQEHQLLTLRRADHAEILQLALRALVSGHAPAPPKGCPLLLLDVTLDSRSAGELVAALCNVASRVLATVPAGDNRSLTALQHALGVEAERLDAHPEVSACRALQSHLFEKTAPEQPAADESLSLFSAPGESRECAEIVRRIRHEAARGVPLDRMAVLLRSSAEYRPYLEEVLGRAGIPAYFARGVERPDPAGRAFLALLRCAQEKLSARRFAEYLSLGEVPDAEADGSPPLAPTSGERWRTPTDELLVAQDSAPEPTNAAVEGSGDPEAPVSAGTLRAPRRWERLICEAAVVGSLERWRCRLDGLHHELLLRKKGLEQEEAETRHVERDLRDLAALRDFALPLIEVLDGLPVQASWGAWYDKLTALATRALRQPDAVLQTLAELAPMAVVEEITLDEVLQVLQPHLATLGVQPARSRHGRVLVAPVELARGLSFEVVFVPGLAERLFPRRIGDDPLLGENARRELGGIERRADRVEAERLALRLAVGAAATALHISYPRVDSTGRARVPSFYALEVLRAAEGQLPGFEELTRRVDACHSRLGWPAPSEPAEAIDLGEHDLALIARAAVSGDSTRREQTLRHLLGDDPVLHRALLCRARRWSRDWTAADGMVSTSPTALAALQRYRPGARPYSATALQNLAHCPYQFFLATIARLRPREEPDWLDQLDPMQRGALIHEVQHRLFEALEHDGLLPVSAANLVQVHEALDRTLNAVAGEQREVLAPAINRVWQDGIERIRGDLREWLRREAVDRSGWRPWRFEHGFGLDPKQPPVDLACGIQLRGRIDMVELGPKDALRVTDRKTGKCRSDAGMVIDGGTTLQPVLYGLAARVLFPRYEVTTGRLDYCTADGRFSSVEVALDAQAEEAARALAQTLDHHVGGGLLPAAPKKDACSWCKFAVVCGAHQERRAARKDPGPLHLLHALRERP